MKWEEGRYGTGYLKKLLSQGKTWDLYLLKYPKGAGIPSHLDYVGYGKRHYRLNIVLWGPQSFVGLALFKFGPIVLFRPDTMLHGVVAQHKWTRYVLSLGWVR